MTGTAPKKTRLSRSTNNHELILLRAISIAAANICKARFLLLPTRQWPSTNSQGRSQQIELTKLTSIEHILEHKFREYFLDSRQLLFKYGLINMYTLTV